ncbi:phage virion morphogenesis protein [Sporomusa sp. KB1]|jgi:phage gpG-like protein|uniref:phage virion morphogenesis protein n=1 Tax=Sporomusa sp. KB1 TaxID=943346 RepID=UPI00119F73C1|nr:phage virion morphogenesis protein [Sporomusa sp. KB1]TWH45899.1 phage gpG-like protein [Sporomusa sp. KB1]
MVDRIEIKVETKGIETISNVLRSMEARGRRLKPVMQKLGAAMVGIIDRNFEAEGRPTKWKPRSPITQANLAISAQDRAKGTKRYQNAKTKGRASILRRESLKAMGNKILSGSGELKDSMNYAAEDGKVLAGPTGAKPYARIHALGGVIRPKKAGALLVPCGNRLLKLQSVTIPKRDYLNVPPGEVPLLARIALDAVSGEMIPR